MAVGLAVLAAVAVADLVKRFLKVQGLAVEVLESRSEGRLRKAAAVGTGDVAAVASE